MGLLTKLKSLLGLEDDRSQVRRGESGVTIEREPDESAEPDAETESAVTGVDTDADDSTGTDPAETTATETETTESETAEPARTETETTEPDAEETEPETAEADAAADESAETDATTEDVTAGSDEADEAADSEAATESSAEAAETEGTTGDEAEATPEETTTESAIEEAEPSEERVGEDEDLESVKGIGAAYAERLRDAGVATVAELATADADQLAEETGLSAKRISRWIDQADSR
jgi:predicted flap endonuclease-1-like 5' DNA nuclease